jgi:hypothetical protein
MPVLSLIGFEAERPARPDGRGSGRAETSARGQQTEVRAKHSSETQHLRDSGQPSLRTITMGSTHTPARLHHSGAHALLRRRGVRFLRAVLSSYKNAITPVFAGQKPRARLRGLCVRDIHLHACRIQRPRIGWIATDQGVRASSPPSSSCWICAQQRHANFAERHRSFARAMSQKFRRMSRCGSS